jgi:uncharacterized protein YggT (Ycf19 family)
MDPPAMWREIRSVPNEEFVLFGLSVLRALVEFAGLLIIAQGLVFLMSFGKHESNPVYRAIRFLTSPVTRAVRRFTPKFVVDQHVPAVALFLLLLVWLALRVLQIMIRARLQLPVTG